MKKLSSLVVRGEKVREVVGSLVESGEEGRKRVVTGNRGEERERSSLRGEKRKLGLGFVLRINRNKS